MSWVWARRGRRREYDAFISYSQAADLPLAAALRRGLRQLNRKPFRAAALQVYRDHENLAAHPDLWAKVADALGRSRYFVLLASPSAAKSRWVRREIGFWQRNRDASTFLIVHTGGEIVWDYDAEDFDWDRTTALPRQLRGWFPAQPGWVPLTWAHEESRLSVRRNPRFHLAVRKLAAPVHGLEQDRLDSEDHRHRRQQIRIALSIVLAVSLLTVSLINQGIRAERNQALADERFANLTAAESVKSTDSLHDPGRALLLAVNAVDMRATGTTSAALFDALESQPRLIRILKGHTANQVVLSGSVGDQGITDLRYNSATGELISAGDDGRIIRWDPGTGRRHVLGTARYVHRGGVVNLAISPDGSRLASTGGAGLAVWDLATERPLFGLYQRAGANSVAFDTGGRLALESCFSCLSTGELFELRDPATGQVINSFRYPRYTIAVASNGTTTAGGGCFTGKLEGGACTQGFLQLWNTTTGQALGEPLISSGREIVAVDLSPDGSRAVAGTRDGWVHVWDVPNRRILASGRSHSGGVTAVRFGVDGKRFATGGTDGRALVWDSSNLGANPRIFAAYDSAVTALAFSPFGNQLATGNALGVIMVWSLDTTVTHTRGTFLPGAATDPRSVAISPDGSMLALGGADGIIDVYDRETHTLVAHFPAAQVCPLKTPADFSKPYQPCYLNAMTFSPDGDMLQVASPAGNVGRWDTRTWSALGDPLQTEVPCRSLACDGRTVTTSAVAFSRDLGLLALGGTGRIWVWDLRARQLVHTIAGHDGDVTTLAFNPGGRFLASGGMDETVRLWDLRDGHQVGKDMRHEGEVLSVAFQPGQTRLASAGADNAVRIWDTGTQDQVAAFRHDGSTDQPALVFSDDGAYLGAATKNNYLAIWDAHTWANIPRPHDPVSIMALTFMPDRPEIVSVAKGPGDNVPTYVNTHNFDVPEWKRRACGIVPRNLDLTLVNAYTRGNPRACPDIPVDDSVVRNRLDSAKYQQAADLLTDDDNDDAELAHLVCLRGTVSRHAREVLPACDRAVALSWGWGPFRSTRAVARAQSGDRAGAIADLRFFLDWANDSGLFRPDFAPEYGLLSAGTLGQREAWISRIAGDQDPFPPDLLDSLWQEYREDHGGKTY